MDLALGSRNNLSSFIFLDPHLGNIKEREREKEGNAVNIQLSRGARQLFQTFWVRSTRVIQGS